jgi:hypothetical protein
LKTKTLVVEGNQSFRNANSNALCYLAPFTKLTRTISSWLPLGKTINLQATQAIDLQMPGTIQGCKGKRSSHHLSLRCMVSLLKQTICEKQASILGRRFGRIPRCHDWIDNGLSLIWLGREIVVIPAEKEKRRVESLDLDHR